jgi:hypothetical protein
MLTDVEATYPPRHLSTWLTDSLAAVGRLDEKPFHSEDAPGVVKPVPPIVGAGEPLGSRLAAGEAEMVGVITGSTVERADADGEGEAAWFPVPYRSTLANAMVNAMAAMIPTVEASGDGRWPATVLSTNRILHPRSSAAGSPYPRTVPPAVR